MKGLTLVLSLVLIVIAVTVTASSASSIPIQSGGESLDPEVAEMLERYIKARRISALGFMGGLPSNWGSFQKRNSELINSILGLPKVMNDAGRKK